LADEVPNEGDVVPYAMISAREFLTKDIPPREYLLGSWLTCRSSNMIFAPRGIGKSMLALNIALAVARGKSFLGWHSYRKGGVLYVDGEMTDIEWRERLQAVGLTAYSSDLDNLRLITYDGLPTETGRRVPNIGRSLDRHRICASLRPGDQLLVLDNISCLTCGIDENDSVAWEPIAEWAEYLKHQYHLAVLFVHHAGKGGGQRGVSKREDPMDTVISLTHPKDYQRHEGARFNLDFTKGRTVDAQESRGLEVVLREGVWVTKNR